MRWVLAFLATAAVGLGTASADTTKNARLWFDPGLHVVGGPVNVSGHAVVLVSARNHSVWLEGIEPASGRMRWKRRFAFSGITPGVAFPPVAVGKVVLALDPERRKDGIVRLEGIRADTGAVAWRGRVQAYIHDAPSACPPPLGKRAVCLVAETAASSSELIAIDAAGRVVAQIPGVERQMGDARDGLFQATGSPSVLVGIRAPGGVRWRTRVAALFGQRYDPDNGWVFDRVGAVEVGSVGEARSGNTVDLGSTRVVGFSGKTGKKQWGRSGEFICGGGPGPTGAWLCDMTGTIAAGPDLHPKVSSDATVTLTGFRPETGATTWTMRVGDIADLLFGNVALKDEHRIVVSDLHGAKHVLDLRSGVARRPEPGESFWCSRMNQFTIVPPKGITRQRMGQSYLRPCDAAKRTAAPVSAPPADLSARFGSISVWAEPGGLVAARFAR
ncbi:MAG TPA: PQQ-binding-like beta-propeller repeat protein [Gaiellaceae bacterium]|nr:PQQ-binding-like beta-propeller repeat protein [Gaiellaceae bacterium]